jgi:NAD(P)-dependent dehydrogenase (short-subunit alcohol dehydrogenase family)
MERTLKRQKMAERAMQQKYVASTDLRKGRVEKLEKLQDDCKDEEEGRVRLLQYLVPDGHVDTTVTTGLKLLENGMNSTAEKEEDNNDDSLTATPTTTSSTTTVLPKLRSCYSCKVRFRNMHHFYDQLCETCAPYNYTKRHQTANMVGKVAIVTGSRVKIGYQVCLKLLRAGATVVATTRFPNNAVSSYRREADFDVWGDRLKVYGLDLRDVVGLEAFTHYLRVTYGNTGIDVLINNACQTVRRPGGYYTPLVQKEEELWSSGDETHRNVLGGCMDFERIRRRLVVADQSSCNDVQHAMIANGGSFSTLGLTSKQVGGGNDTSTMKDNDIEFDPATGETYQCIIAKQKQTISTKNDDDDYVPFESTGIAHSAAMSQMTILPDDVGVDERVMPKGLSDINGQQLDLRTQNSWLLKMDEVSTPELMECMFVNAIAPFVLNSRLKPLMEAPADDPSRPGRYIINVSAMEGKFYRYKMPNHPHTNMAKAALNMLTRTSSEDLAKRSRIYMNSVDTGWINDENPLEKAAKISKDNNFQTPIDEVDAAARILDPVFVGINADGATPGAMKVVKDYGKFFKDYKESEW